MNKYAYIIVYMGIPKNKMFDTMIYSDILVASEVLS